MTPDDLDAFAAVMLSRHIRRATGEMGEGETFCIEMDASAFPAVAMAGDTSPITPGDLGEPERCACGCLKHEEHTAQGLCIGKGCPVSLCSPPAAEGKEKTA